MKRFTIRLPDELFARLMEERQRRGTSTSAIVRAALDDYPGIRRLTGLAFVGLGASGADDTAATMEDFVAAEGTEAISEHSGLSPGRASSDGEDMGGSKVLP